MRSTIVAFLLVPSLYALNNRSAVSVNGLDANPCTVASPCRSFSAAVAATAAGGEVVALDSAGYGQVTIDRALTLSGAPGALASITGTSGFALWVAANPTGAVTVRNLVITASGGAEGVRNDASTELRLIGCLIRGFTSAGVRGAGGDLWIDSTTVLGTGAGTGIDVFGVTGRPPVRATILDSMIAGFQNGVQALAGGNVVINHCTVYGNNNGIYANPHLLDNAFITVERTSIVHNETGVRAAASGASVALITLSNNLFAFNNLGVFIETGGSIQTFGNNQFGTNFLIGSNMSPIAFK